MALAEHCRSLDDLRMFCDTLDDMGVAAEAFSRYTTRPKCTFFGGVRVAPEDRNFQLARQLAARLVERGFMVITGGGGGIMAAAQEGAGAEHSFGLRIKLPFENHPNTTIVNDAKLIDYRHFFARKIGLAKESSAFVVLPGGFGTLDEVYEVLTLIQTGKSPLIPVVLIEQTGGRYWRTWEQFVRDDLLANGFIDPSDLELFSIARSADEAVDIITGFYRNVISCRRHGAELHVHLRHPLTPKALDDLNSRYAEVLSRGRITLDETIKNASGTSTARLVLTPKPKKLGQVRGLLDAVNQSD